MRIQQAQSARSPIPDIWTRNSANAPNNVPVRSESHASSPKLPSRPSVTSSNLSNSGRSESQVPNPSPIPLSSINSKNSSAASSKQSVYTTATSKVSLSASRDNDENSSPITNAMVNRAANQVTPSPHKPQSQKSSSQSMELTYRNICKALENIGTSSTKIYDKSFYECPEMFITKWIDYCNKYGLGYQLRDGSVGVYFNDCTSIILAADNLFVFF